MEIDVLPPAAKALLPLLHHFKKDFYLAGGTALALQIRHRVSVDFDLFSDRPISKTLLRRVEEAFSGSPQQVLVSNDDELTLDIAAVKCTFLHYPFPPLLPLSLGAPIALLSVKEILATKAYTIGRREEFKDYVDVYAGLRGNYSNLQEMIELAGKKYGDAFNDRLFLEQLVYVDDVPEVPIIYMGETIARADIERYLREAVASFKMVA